MWHRRDASRIESMRPSGYLRVRATARAPTLSVTVLMSSRLALPLLLAGLASACLIPPSGTHPVALDAQFDAAEGSTFRLEGTRGTIGVLSIADSRCPSDVRCVTAGDVVVVVALGDD